MNYEEALTLLHSSSVFGIRLGLERLQLLLNEMDNPQNHLQFVHIAGTNGKGSTSTMLSVMLSKSGYRTGLFISPYVLCFRERMQIDGQMISEEDFADCATFVFRCMEKLDCEPLTQFEIETAIALEWYRRKQCDIVCLEVGLGGRFDATNVIPQALVQVITAINLDHTSVLGDSIEQVAFEKAGIIKGGITVSYPLQDEKALSILQERCRQTNSELRLPDLSKLQIMDDDVFDTLFSFDGTLYRKSLAGQFQVLNCITAIEAAHALKEQGISITDNAIGYGIENAFIPARMERISTKPLIILDGSHNPHSAKALQEAMANLLTQNLTLIMAVMSDKEYETIVSMLAPLAKHFIAVSIDNPRALSHIQLAKTAERYCSNVSSYEAVKDALEAVMPTLTSQDSLLVCGSLYFASEARPLLLS